MSGRQGGRAYGLNNLATNGDNDLGSTNLLVSGELERSGIANPGAKITIIAVAAVGGSKVAGAIVAGTTSGASEFNLGDVANG